MRGPERRLRVLQALAPTACLLSTAVGPVQTSPLLGLQSLHILNLGSLLSLPATAWVA